jgi:hypothetical protein
MPGSGQFALLPVWAGALLRFAGAEHNFFAVFRFAAEGGVALLFIVLPPTAHIFRRQQGKGFQKVEKGNEQCYNRGTTTAKKEGAGYKHAEYCTC